MSDHHAPDATQGVVQTRMLGIPVRLHASSLVFLALLGLSLGDPVRIVLWVVLGVVSILLHELGHALVARAAGAVPAVDIAGLGGVTTYRPTERTLRRGWGFAITIAGPLVGIAIGGTLFVLLRAGALPTGGILDDVWSLLLFTSLAWSVLNLLPIPPLDGGRALEQLLPGSRVVRVRRAAWVGLATAALAAVAALLTNQLYALLVVGFFGYRNLRTAQELRGRS